MQRYHVVCPLCGSPCPLYGDEPEEPLSEMKCEECGTIFLYEEKDRVPDPPRPPRPPVNGRPRPHPELEPPEERYGEEPEERYDD